MIWQANDMLYKLLLKVLVSKTDLVAAITYRIGSFFCLGQRSGWLDVGYCVQDKLSGNLDVGYGVQDRLSGNLDVGHYFQHR